MLILKRRRLSFNQRGLAILEIIPVIIVVSVLLRFTYGFFGVIHGATVQSIAVRNYTFETFRHRFRLDMLRETNFIEQFKYKKGVRVHGVRDENDLLASGDPQWFVARRSIMFPAGNDLEDGQSSFQQRVTEQNKIKNGSQNTNVNASPVWLAIKYGICIDFKCGN